MRTLRFVLCTFLFAVPAMAQHDETTAPIAKPILQTRLSTPKPLVMAESTTDGTPKEARKWELMQLNF